MAVARLIEHTAWYAVYSKPQKERFAVANFSNQSIPTLYPQTRIKLPSTRLVERPLFPRYLFAHLEPTQISKARHTRGVSRLVECEAGHPLTIEDWIIAEIEATLDADGFHKLSSKPSPKPGVLVQLGSLVRVALGAFYNTIGVLIGIQGRWASIRVDLGGKTIRVDRDTLIPACV